jgi:hypothetical protein
MRTSKCFDCAQHDALRGLYPELVEGFMLQECKLFICLLFENTTPRFIG